MALEYLRRSLAFDPESNFSYRILGMVYYAKDDFYDAALCFDRAVFFDPDDLSSLLYLGMAQFWNGKTALSQKAFTEAARLSGRESDVLQFTAIQIYNHGQTGYAVYFLKETIKRFPKDEQLRLLLEKMSEKNVLEKLN